VSRFQIIVFDAEFELDFLSVYDPILSFVVLSFQLPLSSPTSNTTDISFPVLHNCWSGPTPSFFCLISHFPPPSFFLFFFDPRGLPFNFPSRPYSDLFA